eukprot:294845-Chlamydomonas_euryale.AAC.2
MLIRFQTFWLWSPLSFLTAPSSPMPSVLPNCTEQSHALCPSYLHRAVPCPLSFLSAPGSPMPSVLPICTEQPHALCPSYLHRAVPCPQTEMSTPAAPPSPAKSHELPICLSTFPPTPPHAAQPGAGRDAGIRRAHCAAAGRVWIAQPEWADGCARVWLALHRRHLTHKRGAWGRAVWGVCGGLEPCGVSAVGLRHVGCLRRG